MRLFRTEYWNLSTNTLRAGSTGRGESLVDIGSYLEPLRGALLAALFDAGVADGLQVSAVIGQSGLTIATGTGIDKLGRVAVLSDGGAAIIDQSVLADQMQQVPVVLVGPTGVSLPTTGPADDFVLSLTWREVLDSASQGGSPTLLHAPWLRLETEATFTDDGQSVVLALVSLDAQGAVTALGPGTRRSVQLPIGGLTFRRPGVQTGTVVGDQAGAQLSPRPDGGLDLLLNGQAAAALSLQGDGKLLLGGDIGIGTAAPGAGLDIDRGANTTPGLRLSATGPGWGAGFQLRNQAGHTYGSYAGDDGSWRFTDVGRGVDLLDIDTTGLVHIPGALTVDGDLRAGRLLLPAGAQIAGDGRLHITGPELLYLLNHDGVVVSKAWGGNGNLTVEGDATVQNRMWAANIGVAGGGQIVGDGVLHITGPGPLYLLNHDGVVVSRAWGGNGSLTVEGDSTLTGNLRVKPGLPGFPSWSGGGIATFDVFAAGALYAGGDFANPTCRFYSNGTKHFVIDHPLDPENRSLSHICLEGPEAAVFYRGSGRLVGGRAEVDLPEYFEALTRPDDRTVMLTPIAEDGEAVTGLAASPVRRGRFTVLGLDASNPRQRFSWQVTAVRADVEPLQVETVKARPEPVLAR